MTTKTISTYIAAGYSLASKYSGLSITASGKIGGTGLLLGTAGQFVVNYGKIAAAPPGVYGAYNGIDVTAGGTVVNISNGAISGYSGVFATNAVSTVVNDGAVNGVGAFGDGLFIDGGSIYNRGAIEGQFNGVASSAYVMLEDTGYVGAENGDGVFLSTGGFLTIGSTPAEIFSGHGDGVDVAAGAATIFSAGKIWSPNKTGVMLGGGGSVTNYGSIIGWVDAIYLAAGSVVVNRGSLSGEVDAGVAAAKAVTLYNFGQISSSADAAKLAAGGEVENAAGGLLTASIGVFAAGAARIDNSGSIFGFQEAVDLGSGGVLNNHSQISSSFGPAVLGAGAVVTLDNTGTIASTSQCGVSLTAGGTVTNGAAHATSALIGGVNGGVVFTASAGSVVNYGSIISDYGSIKAYGGSIVAAGVFFGAGGFTRNGSTMDTAALLRGRIGLYAHAYSTLSNFGTVGGETSDGVHLNAGGVVTNGALTDRTALIYGYSGVFTPNTAARVVNFGTIEGIARYGEGVFLAAGGSLTNGTSVDQSALVEGVNSGVVGAKASSIVNYGSVCGAYADGVLLAAGGSLKNGSGAVTQAQISGAYGVDLAAGGAVTNYGTIDGLTAAGVLIGAGGTLVNGLGSDRTALIQGINGVVANGAAVVVNAATIIGEGYGAAVGLLAGGTLANGSATNSVALVEGYSGLVVDGAGRSSNFGTIAGLGLAGQMGASVSGGALLANGSIGHAGAVIEGYTGVVLAAGSLDNFGTVIGEGGVAVQANGPTSLLVVESGSAFVGSIIGGGGTLELGSGAWTHAGLLSSGGNITLSGPIAATSFSGFGALEIGASASLTLAGNGAVAGGQGLIVAGSLGASGTLTTAGALTVTGALAGTGTLRITGGVANFNGAPTLTIAKVSQGGGTASFNGTAVTVSDAWTQSAGVITAPTGDKAIFTGLGNSFSGAFTGAGTVAFTGGSDALNGASLKAANEIISGASMTMSGAITLTGALSVTSTDLAIAAAGVTLSGGGALNLSNNASNAVLGATPSTSLINLDKITGAGTIANLVLVNQAGGVINATQTAALVINTGANTVTNGGVIECIAAGGLSIASAVANTGTLLVTSGTLAVTGAVSGAGTVRIGGGVADFGSSFSENVTFTSTTGVLELAKSTAYTGSITGFSKTGTTSLDCLDIAFGGSTKATFSGTTASGVLTVTDGTHTAKINLVGNYTASTFTASSDGHGGTSVVDPPASPGRTQTSLSLVGAMARFGAGGAAPVHSCRGLGPEITSMLAAKIT